MTVSRAERAAANVWLLTLSMVAGLLTVQCTNPSATPTNAHLPTNPAAAGLTPQQCGSGVTQPSGRFALVHGFITYTEGSEIWAVDPNQPAKRISLGPSRGMAPIAWSADGSRLLLVERRNAGATGIAQDLCVMNADGSLTRLTSDGLSGEGSFSPDGTKVAFSRGDSGLYVVDLKGGAPRLIAKSYGAWWLGSPAWSPDGSRIAYTIYLEGGPEGFTFEIWTVSPDGTNPRPLIDLGECGGGGCSGGLAWSPDGSMLAFHSQRGSPARSYSIYVMHADGSGLRQITDQLESALWPVWSPQGSRIAFIRVDGPVIQGLGGIQPFTMAPDGSDVKHLEGVVGLPRSEWAWNPMA